jgi:hypothetical protein
MFTTNLDTFKIQERELHQLAVQYRLVKSLGRHNPIIARISESLGRRLILSGQQFINQTRAATQ